MKRAIVFVILLWVLALAVNACASTKQDALKVSWYLKGEGDDALGPMGITILAQVCAPTRSKYVSCTNRVLVQKAELCSSGKFYLHGFAVVGQWSRPKACPPPS